MAGSVSYISRSSHDRIDEVIVIPPSCSFLHFQEQKSILRASKLAYPPDNAQVEWRLHIQLYYASRITIVIAQPSGIHFLVVLCVRGRPSTLIPAFVLNLISEHETLCYVSKAHR